MNRDQAHRIRAHIFNKVDAFQHLPYEDAASEIILAKLEEPTDEKAFFHLAYRRLWGLFTSLYNRQVDISRLGAPTNEWTQEDIDTASAVAAYYKRFGWPATCEAFGIDPRNRKAQKLLSYKWGRATDKPVAGKPRGQRKKIEVSGNADELAKEHGLSRTSAWRAKKRGWITVPIQKLK